MVLVEHDQGTEIGTGKLVGWHDPDENREWIMKNKSRGLEDKRMSVNEAVMRFVPDGRFLPWAGLGMFACPWRLSMRLSGKGNGIYP